MSCVLKNRAAQNQKTKAKIIKTIATLFVFVVAVPSIAGFAITELWNSILVAVCGYAAIGFWQSVGLFLLGQILTGGFILGLFLA